MKWFIPSWNGDVRIEADGPGCVVAVVDPTERERLVLEDITTKLREQKWLAEGQELWKKPQSAYRSHPQRTQVMAPLSEVLGIVAPALLPGRQVLSAVVYRDGMIETVEGTNPAAIVPVAKEAEKKIEKVEAAATVKRPTMCCPDCVPGAVGPATEVLLSFLSPEQHDTWARDRYIVVEGGITGYRYRLAHRDSKAAARQTRICWDLDNNAVVHFHDRTVPPEEEVLAAKLMLEHREHWLRNEASCFDMPGQSVILKNPFGDGLDGTQDAALVEGIGMFALGLAKGLGVLPKGGPNP